MKEKIKDWFSNIVRHGAFYVTFWIFIIITIVWLLKNILNVGDEVVAGISAALVTLIGVKLTNSNSQIALNKQLAHQKSTFQAQLSDQAEGFAEQMKHQNELLERRMKHQSEENDKERKQKFKHDQYIELIKSLSNVQNYLTLSVLSLSDYNEILEKLSQLKEKMNISKLVSSSNISDQLDKVHKKYFNLLTRVTKECNILIEMKNEHKNLNYKNEILQGKIKDITDYFFSNNSDIDKINSNLKLIMQEIEKNNTGLKDITIRIEIETNRIVALLKPDIEEVKISTEVIIKLLNIEFGYSKFEDY